MKGKRSCSSPKTGRDTVFNNIEISGAVILLPKSMLRHTSRLLQLARDETLHRVVFSLYLTDRKAGPGMYKTLTNKKRKSL